MVHSHGDAQCTGHHGPVINLAVQNGVVAEEEKTEIEDDIESADRTMLSTSHGAAAGNGHNHTHAHADGGACSGHHSGGNADDDPHESHEGHHHDHDHQSAGRAEIKGSCCGFTTSLDEIGSSANGQEKDAVSDNESGAAAGQDAGDSHEALVHLPHVHNGLEIGLTAATAYLSAAGAWIGYTVYRSFERIRERLDQTRGVIIDRHENHRIDDPTYFAYDTTLEQQRNRADFQSKWAGAVSGTSSAAIFFGSLFSPLLSAAGLTGLTVTAAAHVKDANDQLTESRAAYQRAKTPSLSDVDSNDNDMQDLREKDRLIRKSVFTQQKSYLWRNRAAWALFGVGAGTLAAGSAASLAAGVVLPPVGFFSGLGALLGGAVGTSIYNNILNDRLGCDVADIIKADMKNPMSHKEVMQKNVDAENERGTAVAYRDRFFEERKVFGSNALAGFTHRAARMLQKTGVILSMGMIPLLIHPFKHRIKRHVMTQGTDALNNDRVKALEDLDKRSHKPANDNDISMADLLGNAGLADTAAGVLLDKMFKRGSNGKMELRSRYRKECPDATKTKDKWKGTFEENIGQYFRIMNSDDVTEKQKKSLVTAINKVLEEQGSLVRITFDNLDSTKDQLLEAMPSILTDSNDKFGDFLKKIEKEFKEDKENKEDYPPALRYGPGNFLTEIETIATGLAENCSCHPVNGIELLKKTQEMTSGDKYLKQVADHCLVYDVRSTAKRKAFAYSTLSDNYDKYYVQQLEAGRKHANAAAMAA